MAEFPALPLWTDAWVADTKHLSRCERGTYLDLLVLMWRSPGCKVPNDHKWLGKRMNMTDAEVSKELVPLIVEFCFSTGNTLTQKRLLREWDWCKTKRVKSTANAKLRWDKEKASCEGNATQQCSLTLPTPPIYNKENKQPPKKKKEKVEVVLPDDWKPTAPHYAYGKKKGLSIDDVDDLAIGMRAWALSSGALKANWFEMFMGWINNNHRKAKENGRQVSGFNGHGNGGYTRQLQDPTLSASKAADRLIERACKGEFSFSPRPNLFADESKDDRRLLPKG